MIKYIFIFISSTTVFSSCALDMVIGKMIFYTTTFQEIAYNMRLVNDLLLTKWVSLNDMSFTK